MMDGIVSLYLWLPLLGVVMISKKSEKEIKKNKNTVIIVIIILLWLSIYIINEGVEKKSSIFWGLRLDELSWPLLILTSLVIVIILLGSYRTEIIRWVSFKLYGKLLLLLQLGLNGVFLVTDVLGFYVYFEITLPLLFLLIGLYGGDRLNEINSESKKEWEKKEKENVEWLRWKKGEVRKSGEKRLRITKNVESSYYLFLYTLLGSLFMLVSFSLIGYMNGSTSYDQQNIIYGSGLSILLFVGILLSYWVKTPIIPFHIWLPIAHSEASLGGSIMLAGIILKLSYYGYVRIMLPMYPEISVWFVNVIYVISVITIVLSGLITLRQNDMKVIVAYSSIGHICVCIIGLFSINILGLTGSYLLGLAHGIVSPLLFLILGGILYDRYHTRNINSYGGLWTMIPLFTVILFVSVLCNIGIPLSGNFLGEVISLGGGLIEIWLLTILGGLGIVLSGAYSIWLYVKIVTLRPSLSLRGLYMKNRYVSEYKNG